MATNTTTATMLRSLIPAFGIYNADGSLSPKLDYFGATMNSPKYRLDKFINSFSPLTVTEEYKYSPDLIAHDYYQDPNLWWLITRYNGVINIMDPVRGIVPGRNLRIPNGADVKRWLQAVSGEPTSNRRGSGLVTF